VGAKLDFLAIGAARSGTTSLHHHLRPHEGIRLPANKEAPFFASQGEYERGWSDFAARLFGRREGRDRPLLGKVTPQYMAGSLYWARAEPPPGDPVELIGTDDPEAAATIVPRRIARHRPEIKLIVILRDPVERALSHYRHAVRQGWESRVAEEAFEHALRPRALRRARLLPSESPSAYVAFGEYARILGGYLAVFDRSQLCLLPFLDLVEDPAGAVRRVLGFLGVEEGTVPATIGRRFNASDSLPRLPWLDTRAIERRASESVAGQRLWRRMPPRARRWTDELFMRASYLEERHNRLTAGGPSPKGDDEAREILRAHYAPWNERLAAALGDVRGVTDAV
jgi:hypothetical protein